MRLIYFVQYFKPEKASGGVLVEDLLEGFAKHGWNVHTYTPTPTRGITKDIRKKYCKKEKRKEVLFDGNLTIHRMSLYREGIGFISRSIRYVIFSGECLWKGFTEPGEIVFSGSGPPTQGVVGGLISKFTNKKFVYNLQDVFPDSLINAGMCIEDSIFVKIGRVIENFTYKNADAIITISEDMKNNILKKGVDPNKVYTVRNWIDTDKIVPVNRENNSLFKELNLDKDKFYITYAGNLGYVQAVDCLVDVADAFKSNSSVEFIIFGSGSEEKKIKESIKSKKLRNIRLLPLQPAERMSEVYSLGNASLVSCREGTGSSGMPSKTWLIMASGTAVLGYFDKGGEFDETIKQANCGVCVQAGNIKELVNAVKELVEHKDKCDEFGQRARDYSVKYVSKDKAITEYIRIIESVNNRNKKRKADQKTAK